MVSRQPRASLPTAVLLDELTVQGRHLVDFAREAGTPAAVPTCPGWTVADLLRHVGEVHRWAASIVATRAGDEGDSLASLGDIPPDDELADWVADGCEALVSTLQAAPPELDCWYFLPAPNPLAFWARRQLHETSVHRMDAQTAASSRISPVPDAVAEDGVDELLTGLVPRPSSRLRSSEPRALLVAPTDSPARWTVLISGDAPVTVREARTADLVVRGPVGRLYPLLWNRMSVAGQGIELEGATELLDLWRSLVTVRWS